MSTLRKNFIEAVLTLKENDDLPENAKYYVLVCQDGWKSKPEGLYDFPHDRDYFERNPKITLENYLESLVYWNGNIGCIGYDLLDDKMKVISQFRI